MFQRNVLKLQMYQVLFICIVLSSSILHRHRFVVKCRFRFYIKANSFNSAARSSPIVFYSKMFILAIIFRDKIYINICKPTNYRSQKQVFFQRVHCLTNIYVIEINKQNIGLYECVCELPFKITARSNMLVTCCEHETTTICLYNCTFPAL